MSDDDDDDIILHTDFILNPRDDTDNKPAWLCHTYSFSHWILGVQLLGQAIVAQLDQVGFGEEDVQRFDVPSK